MKFYLVGGAHTTFIGKFHPDFIWKKHPEYGRRENPTLEEHLREAVKLALEETGVSAASIDRGYVGNFAGELFSNQAHMGAMLVDCHPDLNYKPAMRVEGACASGGLALVSGLDALQAGADVVLVAGAEVQTTRNAKDGADFLARAAHYATQREIDPFTFPCLFARRAKELIDKGQITNEDIGRVVAKAYSNANKNPKAHMNAVKVSLDEAKEENDKNPTFLSNEDFKPYLKVKDCSQVSDGASALVIAGEKGLEKLGKSPADCVEIIGYNFAAAPLSQTPELGKLETTAKAAAKTYADAGIKPEEVQVAEVHDCFAVTEILMYEALGFAQAGKGAELVRRGETELTGKIPVNTGGGLIAFGHPVGATGVKQAVEIFRQMKGQCGDYQLETPPQVGLTANMGGDDRTSVVIAYRNVN